jgi:hypothetical protein
MGDVCAGAGEEICDGPWEPSYEGGAPDGALYFVAIFEGFDGVGVRGRSERGSRIAFFIGQSRNALGMGGLRGRICK